MNDYAQRLTAAMEHAGQKTTALALNLGVSYQAVKKVLDGKSTSLNAANNARAARFLGVSADWLATGSGSMLGVDANADLVGRPRTEMLVPVIGTVQGGTDSYFTSEATYEGRVRYWTPDKNAYAVRVRGDSMHPRYRHGEFLVVVPSLDLITGRDVVVWLDDERAMVKELAWIRDGEIQLRSINENYEPLTLPLAEVVRIERVAGCVTADAIVMD